MREVDAVSDRLHLEEPWETDEGGAGDGEGDVGGGAVGPLLHLPVVVGPADRQVALHPHRHDQVDARAQADPVQRVVEVRVEQVRKHRGVGGPEVHPEHLENGEQDVEAVRDVQGGQDVVEAVTPHLLADQHHNADRVSEKTQASKSW